jgi:serralysin
VSFAPGQATQTVTVQVAGDVAAEANESFTVTLANPQLGVAVATAAAVGIILNDDIASTAANQTLSGSAAPDVFLLGGGIDTVLGRDGVDEFRFLPAAVGPAATNATTLQDLNRAGGEVINLAAIDAIGATLAEDAFSFIGTAAFSAAGQLRWQDQGATRLIQGEVNGDGVADVTIIVTAAGPVEANWFVL